LIAQYKAENFELRKRGRDYEALKAQLMDLERRYKLAQEDTQYRSEIDWRGTGELQERTGAVEDLLYNRQKELKDIVARFYTYRTLLEEKDLELDRLKRDLAVLEEQNFKVSKEKRMIEDEIINLREGRVRAEREVTELASRKQTLSNEHSLINDRTRDAEDKVRALRNEVQKELDRLEIIRRENTQLDNKLNTVLNGKNITKDRTTQVAVVNNRLEGDTKNKEQRLEKLKFQLQRSHKVQDELIIFLDTLQKELARVRAGINVPKVSCIEAGERLKELREENETLQRLLDQYRKDINFQKNLREIEAARRRELELERQELQRETRTRDYEVITTKQALANVKDRHDILLEDKVQISEELSALKQHAEVLESQNIELHNELEKFVETDEVVRHDLNRKPRVEYMMNKNYDELRQSITKVRQSTSPHRSPYK
jgi:myosin protein heavy chain